jgi:hypothetical protein
MIGTVPEWRSADAITFPDMSGAAGVSGKN